MKRFLCIGLAVMLLPVFHEAQEDITFTRSFTRKIRNAGIEFFFPVEQWLKATPLKKDDFMAYDLVLESPGVFEMRIVIERDSPGKTLHPHIQLMSVVSTVSTNDPDDFIRISRFPTLYAKEEYGADYGLFADFTPKGGFSTFTNGRVLCLYRANQALALFIILYDGELDPYFNMPFRFTP